MVLQEVIYYSPIGGKNNIYNHPSALAGTHTTLTRSRQANGACCLTAAPAPRQAIKTNDNDEKPKDSETPLDNTQSKPYFYT